MIISFIINTSLKKQNQDIESLECQCAQYETQKNTLQSKMKQYQEAINNTGIYGENLLKNILALREIQIKLAGLNRNIETGTIHIAYYLFRFRCGCAKA